MHDLKPAAGPWTPVDLVDPRPGSSYLMLGASGFFRAGREERLACGRFDGGSWRETGGGLFFPRLVAEVRQLPSTVRQ